MVLNGGELVAGVADEHAGLAHGAVAHGHALDEPAHRRCRPRSAAHVSPLLSSPATATASLSPCLWSESGCLLLQ